MFIPDQNKLLQISKCTIIIVLQIHASKTFLHCSFNTVNLQNFYWQTTSGSSSVQSGLRRIFFASFKNILVQNTVFRAAVLVLTLVRDVFIISARRTLFRHSLYAFLVIDVRTRLVPDYILSSCCFQSQMNHLLFFFQLGCSF